MANSIAAFRWSSTCHCITLLTAILCYNLQNQHVPVIVFCYCMLTSLVCQQVIQNERVHNSYVHSMIKGVFQYLTMRRAHCGRKGTDGFCQLCPWRHYIWQLQVLQVQSLFLLSLGAWQFFTVSKTHSRYKCNNVFILPTHVNSGWGVYNYSNLFHDLPSSLGHTSHLQHYSELQHDLYVVFPWLIFQCPEVLEISLGLNNQVISVYRIVGKFGGR